MRLSCHPFHRRTFRSHQLFGHQLQSSFRRRDPRNVCCSCLVRYAGLAWLSFIYGDMEVAIVASAAKSPHLHSAHSARSYAASDEYTFNPALCFW